MRRGINPFCKPCLKKCKQYDFVEVVKCPLRELPKKEKRAPLKTPSGTHLRRLS